MSTWVGLLDVVVIQNEFIRPPGPKIMVCVDPAQGTFLQFNTKGHWPQSLAVAKEPHHTFLDYDSFIECGRPFEFDDTSSRTP